ncbi:MAG: DUF11 domain-containing protein [Epsilonproteobacteria bacterium]|nr:DUF11 domain-containing protein [Campylobacterota bacterium]
MKKFNFVLVLGIAAIATTLYAKKASVTLTSSSYKEVHEVNTAGEKVTKYVETGKVLPGDIVMYKNSINNQDSKPARNLVLNNVVPENTEYVENSASCESDCKIIYSVDNGETFDIPENLKVQDGALERAAKASEYTNIRWIIASSLSAESSTFVSFKARLK